MFPEVTLPHLDVVYQVARQWARDGQDPEDLVQETYLRAYAAFGSYRGENPRAWLAAICLNAARSQARRRRRRPWEVPGSGTGTALRKLPPERLLNDRGHHAACQWHWMPAAARRQSRSCP